MNPTPEFWVVMAFIWGGLVGAAILHMALHLIGWILPELARRWIAWRRRASKSKAERRLLDIGPLPEDWTSQTNARSTPHLAQGWTGPQTHTDRLAERRARR